MTRRSPRARASTDAPHVHYDVVSTEAGLDDVVAALHDETALQASMVGREIEIVCDLHAGRGEARVRFTDLTHAYVDENMGTS